MNAERTSSGVGRGAPGAWRTILSGYVRGLNAKGFSPFPLAATRNPCQVTSDAIPIDQVASTGQYLYPHLPIDVHQSTVMLTDSG